MTEDDFMTLVDFKQEAWKLKKSTGRPHSQVLDTLARQKGYPDYQSLHAVSLRDPFGHFEIFPELK